MVKWDNMCVCVWFGIHPTLATMRHFLFRFFSSLLTRAANQFLRILTEKCNYDAHAADIWRT